MNCIQQQHTSLVQTSSGRYKWRLDATSSGISAPNSKRQLKLLQRKIKWLDEQLLKSNKSTTVNEVQQVDRETQTFSEGGTSALESEIQQSASEFSSLQIQRIADEHHQAANLVHPIQSVKSAEGTSVHEVSISESSRSISLLAVSTSNNSVDSGDTSEGSQLGIKGEPSERTDPQSGGEVGADDTQPEEVQTSFDLPTIELGSNITSVACVDHGTVCARSLQSFVVAAPNEVNEREYMIQFDANSSVVIIPDSFLNEDGSDRSIVAEDGQDYDSNAAGVVDHPPTEQQHYLMYSGESIQFCTLWEPTVEKCTRETIRLNIFCYLNDEETSWVQNLLVTGEFKPAAEDEPTPRLSNLPSHVDGRIFPSGDVSRGAMDLSVVSTPTNDDGSSELVYSLGETDFNASQLDEFYDDLEGNVAFGSTPGLEVFGTSCFTNDVRLHSMAEHVQTSSDEMLWNGTSSLELSVIEPLDDTRETTDGAPQQLQLNVRPHQYESDYLSPVLSDESGHHLPTIIEVAASPAASFECNEPAGVSDLSATVRSESSGPLDCHESNGAKLSNAQSMQQENETASEDQSEPTSSIIHAIKPGHAVDGGTVSDFELPDYAANDSAPEIGHVYDDLMQQLDDIDVTKVCAEQTKSEKSHGIESHEADPSEAVDSQRVIPPCQGYELYDQESLGSADSPRMNDDFALAESDCLSFGESVHDRADAAAPVAETGGENENMQMDIVEQARLLAAEEMARIESQSPLKNQPRLLSGHDGFESAQELVPQDEMSVEIRSIQDIVEPNTPSFGSLSECSLDFSDRMNESRISSSKKLDRAKYDSPSALSNCLKRMLSLAKTPIKTPSSDLVNPLSPADELLLLYSTPKSQSSTPLDEGPRYLTLMMEDASCDVDSTTLSDSQTDLTNPFEQDLSELNDLIDDVTEIEESTKRQHKYVTTPTKDDFKTQLDRINTEIDAITPPSLKHRTRPTPVSRHNSSKSTARQSFKFDDTTPSSAKQSAQMCFFFKRSKRTPSSQRPDAESQFSSNSVAVPDNSLKTSPAVEKLETGTGNSSIGIDEALETPCSSRVSRWSNPQSSEKDSLNCMDSSESTVSGRVIMSTAEAPSDYDSFKTPHRSRSEHIASLQKKMLAARQNLGIDVGIQFDADEVKSEVKPVVAQTKDEVPINIQLPHTLPKTTARRNYFHNAPARDDAIVLEEDRLALTPFSSETDAKLTSKQPRRLPGRSPRELKAYQSHVNTIRRRNLHAFDSPAPNQERANLSSPRRLTSYQNEIEGIQKRLNGSRSAGTTPKSDAKKNIAYQKHVGRIRGNAPIRQSPWRP